MPRRMVMMVLNTWACVKGSSVMLHSSIIQPVKAFHQPAYLILVDQNGDMRFLSPEETLRLGDDLKNLLEADFTARFGGRFFCTMPDGRYVYQYQGKDYLLDVSGPDPEGVMKASLEQGKNLLITTFPVVDLYPDPNCDY